MPDNYEAVLLEPKARITVRPSHKYTPGDDEILVRVTAGAVSPFEAKMQNMAMYPVAYPASLGTAFAGTIEATGKGVSGFASGQTVVAFGGGLRKGDLRRGGHQRFAICSPSEIARVSKEADLTQAVTAMSNMTTVVPVLSIKAGLDRPSSSPDPANRAKKVLIYGGTTQLGRLSVQYVKNAGYSVVTTTSPKHQAATAALEPTAIVDHSIAPEEVSKELISHGPYVAVLDAVSQASTQAILAPVMRENANKGASKLVYAVGPVLQQHEGVEFSMNSWPGFLKTDPKGPELDRWLFEDYFPGLFNGAYSYVPAEVEKVPGGLNAVQSMLDRVLSVSGKKLVYNPWDE